jgi:hypothetical protein
VGERGGAEAWPERPDDRSSVAASRLLHLGVGPCCAQFDSGGR